MEVPTRCLFAASNGCRAVAFNKGLCNTHYSQAKKRVDEGKTTWEELADLGLAAPVETDFDKALARAREAKKAGES